MSSRTIYIRKTFTREDLALELVATTDVAERIGVTRNAIAQWIRRYPESVPAPVAVTSAGSIYLWSDWEAWILATGRRAREIVYSEK